MLIKKNKFKFFKQNVVKYNGSFLSKKVKVVSSSVPFNLITFRWSQNNVFLTVVNSHKGMLLTLSAGNLKFKGKSKRVLTLIKGLLVNVNFLQSQGHLKKNVGLVIRFIGFQVGFYNSKKYILSYLDKFFLHTLLVEDITPIAHNGCRTKTKKNIKRKRKLRIDRRYKFK